MGRSSFMLTILYSTVSILLGFVASVLPLKIILLLPSQQKVPTILFDWFSEKETLILFLCCVSILLIILTFFLKNLANRKIKINLESIESAVADNHIPYKQKKVSNIFRNSFTITTGIILTLVYLSALSIIYPSLLAFFCVYTCIIFGMVALGKKFNIVNFDKFKANQRNSFISTTVMLTSVFFAVFDNIFLGNNYNFITIIIGIIIVRQTCNSSLKIANGMMILNKATLILHITNKELKNH